MRAFLPACVAFSVLGTGGYFVLNSLQISSGARFTSDAARIDANWSWRATNTTDPEKGCAPRAIW